MLRARPGFTLAEVLVALVLTAIIGAAVTGAFISQSAFFDQQEKVSFARGVSRGGMNMLMSELRMIERRDGVVSASSSHLTLRVPYALGLVCGRTAVLTVSRLPADPSVVSSAGFSGFAWRGAHPDSGYNYIEGSQVSLANGSALVCAASSVGVIPAAEGGAVIQLLPTHSGAAIGAPVFLFQTITYEFKESAAVPGRIGLWRRTHHLPALSTLPEWEELVAPFDTTAKFRFFVNDAPVAQDGVPTPRSAITGIELTLDGLSERPDSDGSYRSVPLRTAVFFRNR